MEVPKRTPLLETEAAQTPYTYSVMPLAGNTHVESAYIVVSEEHPENVVQVNERRRVEAIGDDRSRGTRTREALRKHFFG